MRYFILNLADYIEWRNKVSLRYRFYTFFEQPIVYEIPLPPDFEIHNDEIYVRENSILGRVGRCPKQFLTEINSG